MMISLEGHTARFVLRDLAYRYAYLSVARIVTVRGAPKHAVDDELRWRELRATLQSTQMPGNELPSVPEPEWRPVYDLSADYRETKPGKVVRVADIAMVVGRETALKKGAKRKPTYNRSQNVKAAEVWAEAFVAWMLDDGPPVEQALAAKAVA